MTEKKPVIPTLRDEIEENIPKGLSQIVTIKEIDFVVHTPERTAKISEGVDLVIKEEEITLGVVTEVELKKPSEKYKLKPGNERKD